MCPKDWFFLPHMNPDVAVLDFWPLLHDSQVNSAKFWRPYIYMYMNIYIYMYIYICMFIYIYIYVWYICSYAYIHIYIDIWSNTIRIISCIYIIYNIHVFLKCVCPPYVFFLRPEGLHLAVGCLACLACLSHAFEYKRQAFWKGHVGHIKNGA